MHRGSPQAIEKVDGMMIGEKTVQAPRAVKWAEVGTEVHTLEPPLKLLFMHSKQGRPPAETVPDLRLRPLNRAVPSSSAAPYAV